MGAFWSSDNTNSWLIVYLYISHPYTGFFMHHSNNKSCGYDNPFRQNKHTQNYRVHAYSYLYRNYMTVY